MWVGSLSCDCEAETRFQRVAKPKRTVKWNVSGFKKPEFREAYGKRLDKRLQEEKCEEEREIDDIWKEEIDMGVEIDETWNKLKEDIAIVAEMCERDRMSKKQNWMNSEILNKMEERRKAKNRKDDGRYTRLKHEIQKLCREAKDKYYEDKCKAIT